MIKRIFTIGVLILALMIAIKDHRMLRIAGLTGGCSAVQTSADGSQLQACRRGKLEGWPDLSHRGCTYAGHTGTKQFWRCPAPVVASPAGQ